MNLGLTNLAKIMENVTNRLSNPYISDMSNILVANLQSFKIKTNCKSVLINNKHPSHRTIETLGYFVYIKLSALMRPDPIYKFF